MNEVKRKYPYQAQVERFSHLYTDPISRNIIRSYQSYIEEEPYSQQGEELDFILNLYVTNVSFFSFVQQEYQKDELPYFLGFLEEMKQLKGKYQNSFKKKVTM